MRPERMRRRERSRVPALAVWCGFLFSWLTGLSLAAQEPATPQSVQAGARIFRVQGCGGCHAIFGQGGGVGPDLGTSLARRSLPSLAAALWNHLPTMARTLAAAGRSPERLEPWEAADLAAFLFWLDGTTAGGDPARGARLFERRACIRCHQFGGRGGVIGPNLDFLSEFGTPIQIAAALWNHGPKMEERMAELGLPRPRLEARDLADIIAFLQRAGRGLPLEPIHALPGRPDAGEAVFREKGCVDCHRVRARGGAVGPDLGARRYGDVLGLATAFWNAMPGMLRELRRRNRTLPPLSATEMADLVAFVGAGGYFEGGGSAPAGEQVVRRRGCLSCHTLRGAGGSRAGELADYPALSRPSGIMATLWNHAVEAGEALRSRPELFPSITPEEMSDLIAFLMQLGGGQ